MDGMECMFKLSQYADDTSIISDGSSESKDGTLRVLDYFTDLSGLIINYTKLKWLYMLYGKEDIFKTCISPYKMETELD